MRKKKIVWHTDFCGAKTGNGRASRENLFHLFRTGKYEIVEYAMNKPWQSPEFSRVPWKVYGAMPENEQEIAHVANHPNREAIFRQIAYGSHNIDRVIELEKPDVYIGCQDIWAFAGFWDKKWWSKLTPVLNITLDSLPILPQAIEAAKKTPNFFVWAKFAQEAMNGMGLDNVRTLHGPINTEQFKKLSFGEKISLREKFSIEKDAFIIGFVFRNQLRKSVLNLLEAFQLFQNSNPKSKAKLLLHTNFEEKDQGWDIISEVNRLGINVNDILTTYVCRHCKEYEVKPFSGHDARCPFCGVGPGARPDTRTGQCHANVNFGITESQLNEVYNLMDAYVHPFTSGGQEIPIQEAKLCELVTLVTDYSCGTEYCNEDSGGMPLEWSSYREHQTQFIKASTLPFSMFKQISKFHSMNDRKKQEMGRKARAFIIKECSSENVGAIWESIIDGAPFCEWDWDIKEKKANTEFPYEEIEDNEEFVNSLYHNILQRDADEDGLKNWLSDISKGRSKKSVYDFFVQEAKNLNAKNYPVKIEDLVDKDDLGKAVLVAMPGTIGDCFIITSLFESIKELYPDKEIYVGTAPQYAPIFSGNPYVKKIIPFAPVMESELAMCGHGGHKAIFSVLYTPHFSTQKTINYYTKNVALSLS